MRLSPSGRTRKRRRAESKKGKLERAHQDMKYTNYNDVVIYTQMCHYNVGLSRRLEQILDHNIQRT